MKKFYLLLVIFFSLLGCSNNSVKDIAIDIQTRTDAKTPLNEVEEAGTQCTTNADCKNTDCSGLFLPAPMPECINNTCECTYSYCVEIGGCE